MSQDQETTDQNPKTPGRPEVYSEDLAAELCSRLAEGISLRSACSEEGMPSTTTVFRWMARYPTFREQYARAKEESADAMAEDVLDIADDGHNDWMEREYGDQTAWVTNGEALQRSRLRVDTRKFLMAKMKPKRYGDKLDVTSDGKALPTPIYGGMSARSTDKVQLSGHDGDEEGVQPTG